jgi:hypothetical protein
MVLLLASLITSLKIYAEHDLNSLQTLWEERKYKEVAAKLIEYRKGPFGENALVDYMIATSLCQIPDLRQDGNKYFRWILSHYSLDKRSRELVIREMSECPHKDRPYKIVFVTQRSGGGAAGTKGKIYHWLDKENAPLTSDPVEVLRYIPQEEFRKRLSWTLDRENSPRQFEKMVGIGFNVKLSNKFVVISPKNYDQDELKDIEIELEKYLHFYTSQYNIPNQPYLLTSYVVPSGGVRDLAERIHGIKVSEATIGYSFQDDLSIIGNNSGTLAHELFHLMVRINFGDIPPWMEEGMAALYEVSDIVGGSIVGLPNWRGKVLRRFWGLRPSIRDLVRMDWRSFDNEENDYEAKRQATNHAMARYFMLFLQNKQKLGAVYSSFRDRKVEDMQIDPGTDAVNMLESILKISLSELDKYFTQWFNNLPHKDY